jgi:AraC-like DNA-binding protein
MDMTFASQPVDYDHGAVHAEPAGPLSMRIDVEDRGSNGHITGAVRDFGSVKVARKRDDSSGVWSICIERASLEPLLSGMQTPRRSLRGDDPALRLLRAYLAALFALDEDLDPTLAATHIRELVLSALGVRDDVQALMRDGGAHAARQGAVLDVISRRAGEPGLDPAEVAAQAGISVRYLHRLLEPTGRTFTEHLVRARLERASAMLRDRAYAHLKIAEIAARAGFADISHFNRSFRRAFGDTPFGMRVRAARAAG